ncbi:TPA: endonuclease domain-containing protein [Vibrio cholerae]|nr:endonuclease domain-containing protein [Vibrio cholerae]
MDSNPQRSKVFRQYLRNNMTHPEQRLWQHLRHFQLGVKFRRQFGVGNYVLDFYCSTYKLAVEIDGDSHFSEGGKIHDEQRTAYLTRHGIRVVRYTNQEVEQQLTDVIDFVIYRLASASIKIPHPNPPLKGEGNKLNLAD